MIQAYFAMEVRSLILLGAILLHVPYFRSAIKQSSCHELRSFLIRVSALDQLPDMAFHLFYKCALFAILGGAFFQSMTERTQVVIFGSIVYEIRISLG